MLSPACPPRPPAGCGAQSPGGGYLGRDRGGSRKPRHRRTARVRAGLDEAWACREGRASGLGDWSSACAARAPDSSGRGSVLWVWACQILDQGFAWLGVRIGSDADLGLGIRAFRGWARLGVGAVSSPRRWIEARPPGSVGAWVLTCGIPMLECVPFEATPWAWSGGRGAYGAKEPDFPCTSLSRAFACVPAMAPSSPPAPRDDAPSEFPLRWASVPFVGDRLRPLFSTPRLRSRSRP